MKRLDKKDIEDIAALTPMQEGMLFHYLRDPESDVYVEQLGLEVSGEIDVEVFEKSWDVVVKTNEMLRTVFRWEKLDTPAQVVLKQHNPDLEFFDLSFIEDHVEQQKKLEHIKLEDRKLKFDLREVPFRVILCKLSDKDYHMVISNHHILYDGWSSGIILKEFFQAYEALEKGEAEQTTVIKQPFREFIQWQKKQEQDKQKKFWESYFKGFDTQTELPIKQKSVKMNKGPRGTPVKEFGFALEKGLSDRLDTFIKKHRVTLAAFFYCAWGILLQKYCGSDDVVFGTTISGRSAPINGIENMVGLFINTLPLRVTAKTGETLLDLLLEVNDSLLHREKYESTPLVDIQEYSRRETGRELFDSLLVMENYPLDLPPTVHSYSAVESTNYDFNIAITLHGGIDVRLLYNEELFAEDVIFRLSRHFMCILNEITVHPHTPIHAIDILSREEKKQLLLDFNDIRPGFPNDKTIHGLFAEQVSRTPDNTAIVGSWQGVAPPTHKGAVGKKEKTGEAVQLTYRELDEESGQLAFLLKEKGVKPGTIVAIMAERSIEMIVGILGILKSGAAYLPINPENPGSRTQYMLADCRPTAMVSTRSLAEEGEKIFKENIFVYPVGPVAKKQPAAAFSNPQPAANPFNYAYIIYTSGSTGRPKGVAITHSNFSPLVHWGYTLGISPKDRVIQSPSYYFDWSVWEIFITLTTGAALYMITEEILLNPEAEVDFIRENAVTVLHVTPTQHQYLINVGKKLETLKYLFIGGERLTVDLLTRSLESVNDDCRVFNMYGATEAAIISAVLEIHRPRVDEYKCLSGVPIGRTIANMGLVILDKDSKLCPIGVAGELYIAGDALANGYLNDPGKTLKSFLKNVFREIKSERLYKTGDRVRWLPDGTIEFLGRIDTQVKIRGFRIEPGEIEKRLLSHEDIKEAAVIAIESDDFEKFLCAYIVSADAGSLEKKPGTLNRTELRKYLSGQLPDYMIPSFFVLLEKMPLTPNGKIDWKALPQPQIVPGEMVVEPREELEKKLAEIWSGLLGIEKNVIGIDDNFFQLGGHSLKATLLVSKMHKELNVNVALVDVFVFPTIREMAAHIKDINGPIEAEYAAIEPAEEKYYYALSSVQKRLYCLYQADKGATGYNMPVIVRLEGKLEKERLEETFKQLIVRHESFRTSFAQVKGEPVQKVHETAAFAIEYHEADGFSTVEDITRDFIRPFDLSQAPLLRVGLVKIAEETHILMVDMHHIITDGTSTGILVREFMVLVEEEELPPLNIRYKDFSEWQRAEKEKESMKKQEEFWLKEFGGGVPVLDLPCDYPRPPERSFEGASIDFELSREESGALKRAAQEEDVTIYMVLLALFNILVYRLCDREDIVVGTPVAGRRHEELQQTIGMFVNTLALRNYPEGTSTFKEFLKDVKERTLRAFENQGYPFEELAEKVAPERDNSRNPLFDVMFVLQNLDIPELRIPGLTLVPYPYKSLAAKFDLTMICIEKGDTLCFTLEYGTKLFKPETIEQFIRYFKDIAAAVIEDRDIHLSNIKMSFHFVEPESALSREAEGHFGF